MTDSKFPFVDASFAAEMLGVQTADILDWINEGRLHAYGGKDRNPFVRTAEVQELAATLGKELDRPPAKRRAADNPVRRVELRLRHDARWSDIAERDIESWAREQDAHGLAAARTVAETALDRLSRIIDAVEKSRD